MLYRAAGGITRPRRNKQVLLGIAWCAALSGRLLFSWRAWQSIRELTVRRDRRARRARRAIETSGRVAAQNCCSCGLRSF